MPVRTEIVGGDYIDLRFGSWKNALEGVGAWNSNMEYFPIALEKTKLYQAELAAQEEKYNAEQARKKPRKRKRGARPFGGSLRGRRCGGMKKRKIPLQGKGRRFRGDLWLDEKLTGRTLDALRRKGVRFADGVNPRKTAEFQAEYQRQLTQFRQEQSAKKAAKQEAQRAARQVERQEELPEDKP